MQREGLHCAPLSIIGEVKLNASACLFNKQFLLLGNIYSTLCNQDGYGVLDVRKFVNGTPTIIGADLSLMQSLRLKQLTSNIDTAISEARTKILKSIKVNKKETVLIWMCLYWNLTSTFTSPNQL